MSIGELGVSHSTVSVVAVIGIGDLGESQCREKPGGVAMIALGVSVKIYSKALLYFYIFLQAEVRSIGLGVDGC